MSSLIFPANSWLCPDCLGPNPMPKEGDTGICSSCAKTSFTRPTTEQKQTASASLLGVWICTKCTTLNLSTKDESLGVCQSCKAFAFSDSKSSASVETPGQRLAKLTEKTEALRFSPQAGSWIESRCTLAAKRGEYETTISFTDMCINTGINEKTITSEKGKEWLEGMGYTVILHLERSVCDMLKAVGITLSWGHHIKENAEQS